ARRPYPPTSPARPAHSLPCGAIQVPRWSSGLCRRGSPGLHWDQDPQRRAAATSCPPQKGPARREPPPPIRKRRQASGWSCVDRELEVSARRLEKLLLWPLSTPPRWEISFPLPPRS